MIYYLYNNDENSLITDEETQQPRTVEKATAEMTHDSSLLHRNQNLLILKNRLLLVSSEASWKLVIIVLFANIIYTQL